MPSLQQQLLDYTSRDGYRPEKPKSLAKKLGITKKRQSEFDAALHELISDGRLRFLDSGRVALSVPPGFVLGVIQKTASGAGFLIPHEPRPPGLEGDVYIDRRDMRDAQRGDEVLVRLIGRRRTEAKLRWLFANYRFGTVEQLVAEHQARASVPSAV